MLESGGANESFSYTKVYSDGASGWQVLPSTTGGGAGGEGSGTGGGATGYGWTSSSTASRRLCWIGGTTPGARQPKRQQQHLLYLQHHRGLQRHRLERGGPKVLLRQRLRERPVLAVSQTGKASPPRTAARTTTAEQAFLDGNGTWQPLFSASGGAGGGSGCGSGTLSATAYVENPDGLERERRRVGSQ